jgi:hypothetical protein
MTLYPTRSWASYEEDIARLGEHRFAGPSRNLDFLRSLRFVEDVSEHLTERGLSYFTLRSIQGAPAAAEVVLRDSLRELPSAAALLQLLSGLGRIPRQRAETVLRSQRLADGLSPRSLGGLLALLNKTKLITYSKSTATFEVLSKPRAEPEPPRSIFLAPETPYGNRVWLRRILEECDEFIYWLDKHFLAAGLEPLWEAADRSRINEVRILSLSLAENSGRRASRAYHDLRVELKARGITLEWRFIESTKIRATHDRWIIGRSVARNVPDVGSVLAGRHSELNLSDQVDTLRRLFLSYWSVAAPRETSERATAA